MTVIAVEALCPLEQPHSTHAPSVKFVMISSTARLNSILSLHGWLRAWQNALLAWAQSMAFGIGAVSTVSKQLAYE